tara:strand:- start:503 stop:652 length:150 start_codon:yes stop_codon:yes gene_type:complete
MNRAQRRAKNSKKGDRYLQAKPKFDRGNIIAKQMRTAKSIAHIRTTDDV